MLKDIRYTTIKLLIEANQIIDFKQIFNHIPKTIVAHDLRKNTGRMNRIIANAITMSCKDVLRLSELIEVHESIILQLIKTQYQKKGFKPEGKKLNNNVQQ